MFDRIKKFYNKELWTKQMVKDAVIAGAIIAEEYKSITGEDYPA